MNEAALSPVAREAYQACQRAMIALAPKLVEFTYVDSTGDASARRAEPYELKDGKLFAWCLTRNAIRQFKLESMTEVRVGESFKPRLADGKQLLVKVPC